MPAGIKRNMTIDEIVNVCSERVDYTFPTESRKQAYTFDGTGDYKECSRRVAQLTDLDFVGRTFKMGTFQIDSEPKVSDFYAISAFYFGTRPLRLNQNGQISKSQFEKETETICNYSLNDWRKTNFLEKDIFKYCFALNYIYK